MKVLYVNQTADVSGAERSLLALLKGIDGKVDAVVACPDGQLAEEVEALGIPRLPIAGTKVSFRLHPAHTARGIRDVVRSDGQLARIAKRLEPDLIHANTTRAALLAIAPPVHRVPVVAHIRDWTPSGRLPRLVHQLIGRRADQVLANSAYVAGQFADIPTRRSIRIVHNPIDLDRFGASADGAPIRRELDIAADEKVVAVVGQITPWKAQDEAIRAMAEVAASGVAARLLIVGSAKFDDPGAQYDNPAFEASLRPLAASLGIEDRVHLLGERDDIPAVLAAADLLLLSSWREAFGRIAVEAMAVGVPVIATEDGGPAEIVAHGIDGELVPPRRPDLWAPAIAALLQDDERRREMGERAKVRAAAFGIAQHVEIILSVYGSLR